MHEALKVGYVAMRYYAKKNPERSYTKEQALKQFSKDKNKDAKILQHVLKEISKEILK